MSVTLRCWGRVFGDIDPETGTMEVRCTRARCGKTKDNIILHTFDIATGELISTKTFANPRTTTSQTRSA